MDEFFNCEESEVWKHEILFETDHKILVDLAHYADMPEDERRQMLDRLEQRWQEYLQWHEKKYPSFYSK